MLPDNVIILPDNVINSILLPDNVIILHDNVITYTFHVGLNRFRGFHGGFLHLVHVVYFAYFAILQLLLVGSFLDYIQSAGSKSEVTFVPAGKTFELCILTTFMNGGLVVICYFTTVCFIDNELVGTNPGIDDLTSVLFPCYKVRVSNAHRRVSLPAQS